MLLVLRSKKRRFMMIEPPRELIRRRVLEIHDRIFVAVKQIEIKQVSGAMQQPAIIDFRFRVDAFFVKAREGRGRSDAVKTVAVIKQTKFHSCADEILKKFRVQSSAC